MARTSSLRFHLALEDLGVGRLWTVTPFVDGVSLVELADYAETGTPPRVRRRRATAGAEPRHAGLVVGPTPARTGWQGPYRDEDAEPWRDDPGNGPLNCLLGCICGVTACNPVAARVTITPSLVTWSAFRTRSGGPDPGLLGRLGPFSFERAQYDRALAAPTQD